MFFYIYVMFLSKFACISTVDWFWSWVNMELNLFSFLPLLLSLKMKSFSEFSIKYFLVQILGSSMMIFGLISVEFMYNFIYLFSGLFCKLGIFPVSVLLIDISSKVNWLSLGFMSSFMKVAPMYLSSNMLDQSHYMLLILTGGSGLFWGMYYNCMMNIYMGGSLMHMYWSMSVAPSSWFIYWMFYFLISMSLCLTFMDLGLRDSKDLMVLGYVEIYGLFFQLLSLMGFPPLTGFLLKFWCLTLLSNYYMIFFLTFISSLFNYLYLRWLVNMFIYAKPFYSLGGFFMNLGNYFSLISVCFIISFL
uniref:NADH dehydrogenase subunit 2 n=1 Tax=Sacculina confragosa TaxID=238040 RepID=UPI002551FFA6|nr:NADH dehydrogenase subunit 2 [Sacculina confragosa]WGU20862.1 NADH dehydrogenase subunit 2 [Sacculina confragosa]